MELSGFIGVSDVLRSGVYALVHKGVVIYVGKSKTMLARIYTHRAQWGKKSMPWLPVKGILFDEVFVRPCAPAVIDELEYDMINLYKPKHNIQLKHFGKSLAPITLTICGVDVVLNRPRPQNQIIERRL